jgi:CRISPR-associated RAMP protein (TIGR02581 family)
LGEVGGSLVPLEIKGKLVAESPLFVGCGGKDYGFTDANLQLIRLQAGEKLLPIIPASSLKGVFRSRSEIVLRQAGKKVCNLFAKENYSQKAKKVKEWEENLSPDEVFTNFVSDTDICDVCKIFGFSGYYSLVQFANAIPEHEDCFDTQTMIALRPDRTIPRTAEYIKPGTCFDFLVRFRRFDEKIAWAAGLLLTIIDEINEQKIQVGGQKTRGYGWCRIKLEKPDESERKRLIEKWKEYAGKTG